MKQTAQNTVRVSLHYLVALSVGARKPSRTQHARQKMLIAEPMSPDDLGQLAHRLAQSKIRADTAKLTAQITQGFYAGS